MSGLRKMKKYDWKDSNMALVGSKTDRAVKKQSAETEPAWKGSGQREGLQIWRIVKFEVIHWPKESYGQFYNGDSYIVLNTYKEEDEMHYDIHFWIGKYSTQDEYGTAAYKTVELDTFLNDKPVQHREVEGYESELFKSYFDKMTIMEGGAETGFNHVVPEEYKPRLLHFFGQKRTVEIKQVRLCKSRLNSDDIFILDLGTKIYQFNGRNGNKDEKFKAGQYVQQLEAERGGKAKSEVLDEDDMPEDHEFYTSLNDEDDDDDEEEQVPTDYTKELYRLSDFTGNLVLTKEKKGKITLNDFDTNDTFLLDLKTELIVWIGQRTSSDEKSKALQYAHEYLRKSDHSLIPVTCVKEGIKSRSLDMALSA
ncbi:hypothetical protein ACJMK2_016221 [Sinanodonta woodiana]|uniref:Actin-modulator n=1 Tax=Sinanodonta woodiana TaxID=1069815 RepID=A0ABD3USX8_SINWO